jgi:low temperature requirement protein LtrA
MFRVIVPNQHGRVTNVELFFDLVLAVSSGLASWWPGRSGHMAERCSLFVIIALGEAVVVNGATFAELSGRRHHPAAGAVVVRRRPPAAWAIGGRR